MEPKPCRYCEKLFTPTQAARVYCSKKCFYEHRKEKATIHDTCKNCGEPITYKKGRPIKFCSYSCGAQWRYRDKNTEHTCDYCGGTFHRSPSQVSGERSFCNRDCFGKWKSENTPKGTDSPLWKQKQKVCEHCGETYSVHAFRYETSRFCSIPCLNRSISKSGEEHHNWNGGYDPYYGPNWRKQRRRARKRDNYTCQECGKSQDENGRSLDVHHITPFWEFGIERYKEANHLSNLISLCRVCHAATEWQTNGNR